MVISNIPNWFTVKIDTIDSMSNVCDSIGPFYLVDLLTDSVCIVNDNALTHMVNYALLKLNNSCFNSLMMYYWRVIQSRRKLVLFYLNISFTQSLSATFCMKGQNFMNSVSILASKETFASKWHFSCQPKMNAERRYRKANYANNTYLN